MMNRSIDVLVAGAPGLAEALRTSGRFARVLACQSTSEMKDLISRNLLGEARPESFVFMFSPLLQEDVPGITVEALVAKLTGDEFRVVVLDTHARSREIVRRNPAAGLFSAPFTLNTVLGGLSGTGVGLIEPVAQAWAHTPFDPSDAQAVLALIAQSELDPSQDERLDSRELAPWATQPSPPTDPGPTSSPAQAPAAWGQTPVPTPQTPAAWSDSPASATPPVSTWGEAPAPVVQPPAAWGQAESTPSSEPTTSWGETTSPGSWGSAQPSSTPQQSPSAQQDAQGNWGQAAQDSWGVADTEPQPTDTGWGAAAPAADTWGQAMPIGEPSPSGSQAAPVTDPAQAWGQAAPASDPTQAWGQAAPVGDPTQAWGQSADTSGWGSAAQPSGWGSAPVFDTPAQVQGAFSNQVLPQRKGFVIAMAVSKGGAGKSTLALNLGVWLGLRLRQSGKTVCVVDANYQQADIGKQLHRYSPNIVSLAKNPQDQDPQRITQHLLHMPNLHTSFLLGPTGVDDANPLWITPELYAHAVEVLRSLFDYIVIDTPVAEFHNEIFDRFVIPHADYIAVPVTPDIVTLQNTDNWLQGICQAKHQGGKGFERERVGIILNMQTDGVGMGEPEVQRNLASWHFLGSVPASKVWQAARNEEEIVATRNYAEVNAAFSRILGGITQDPDILSGTAPTAQPDSKRSKWAIKKRK